MTDEVKEAESTKSKAVEVPSARSVGKVRVTDPFGIAFQDEHGELRQHERGEVVEVSADVAKQLFREGKVVPEEAGAPPFVERR